MWTLYLACLLFGGFLLALTLFAGGDAEVEMEAEVDVDASGADAAEGVAGDAAEGVAADAAAGAAADAAADAGSEAAPGPAADTATDAAADAEAAGEGVAAAARYLSYRNIVFFTAFFGLTGTLLSVLRVGSTATLVAALGAGVFSALVVQRLMDYLRRSESGAADDLADVEGALARVVVGLSASRPGKVSVQAGDRTHQLLATLHDAAEVTELKVGSDVLIVRVKNGVASVIEAPLPS
jgi:hypothetical protein